MPKKRLPENAGLPKRWTRRRNAYYYQVPPGLERLWDGKKLFKLGNNLQEAAKEWASRVEYESRHAEKVDQLLDRYSLEVIPEKAKASQEKDIRSIPRLRAVFGRMKIGALTPRDVYEYFDIRSKGNGKLRGGKTTAKHEIALLSHAYTKAVEWGLINAHPFKGQIVLKAGKPRTRYIEDWEILEVLKMPSPSPRGGVAMIKAYIRLKLLTGLRQRDMLSLTESNLTEKGIELVISKTGKKHGIEWSDSLRNAVAAVKASRPLAFSPYLFATREGKGYVDENTGLATGFHSIWQRFMARVLAETAIEERFTEHDLRAKCASDAASLEHAKELLSHADSRITERVYRRKVTFVKPAK